MRSRRLSALLVCAVTLGACREPTASKVKQPPAPPDQKLNATYRADLAQVHIRHQGYERAITHLKAALAEEKDGTERAKLFQMLAQAYGASGQLKSAQDAAQAAVDALPKRSEADTDEILVTAELHARAGNWRAATPFFERAYAEARTEEIRFRGMQGMLRGWKFTQKLGEQIAGLEKKTEKNPRDADAWMLLGEAYAVETGEAGDAIQPFERGLAQRPNDRAAIERLLAIYDEAEVFRKQIPLLERLIRKYPNEEANFLVKLADAYGADNRPKKAAAMADAMVNKPPFSPILVKERGRIYRENGRPADAVAIFEKLVENPRNKGEAEVLKLELAKTYCVANMRDKAQAVLQSMLNSNPHPTMASYVQTLAKDMTEIGCKPVVAAATPKKSPVEAATTALPDPDSKVVKKDDTPKAAGSKPEAGTADPKNAKPPESTKPEKVVKEAPPSVDFKVANPDEEPAFGEEP